VLEATIAALDAEPEFAAAPIETALKAALIDRLGLKPRVAFQAVRVAVTGRTVSPPLYESMELLGRESSMLRLRSALALASGH
jgi:glutamyl-tRNA synthetase